MVNLEIPSSQPSIFERTTIEEIKRQAEIFLCLNAAKTHHGCGTSEFCKFCGANKALTFAGKNIANTQECRISTSLNKVYSREYQRFF